MTERPIDNARFRKKWKIFTGSRAFYNSCLSEDGCPDSQVLLAKQLLEEDCEQNQRLGVYCLVEASEQGHEEATSILRQCLESGRGISYLNIGDVKTCLSTPLAEKVSRRAARELFANLSQGEHYITSDQLYEEMERAQKCSGKEARNSIQEKEQPHCSKDIDWASLNYVSPQKLTEDMLISAASHHSKGELPIVHHVMMVNKQQTRRNSLQASLLYPLGVVRSYYEYFVDFLGKRPIKSFLPLNFSCIVVLAIFSSMGFEGFMEVVPALIYYSALCLMVTTTCQMLTKKWEFDQLKRWSNLLVAWGGPQVNAEEAQWTHCSNNIYPCFVFLVALIANILLTPFLSPYNIPHSELTVVSVIASLLTLYNFSWYKGKLDYLAIASFGVGMLARYPYETDEVVSTDWRFIDLKVPNFASFVVGNGIEFCLNFKVIFFLMMPGLLIKMGSREKWKGVYYSLVPHLISLSWWQMAVVLSNGATRFGLIRSCLAVLVVILFVPLAGLTIILLPLLALLRFILSTESILPVSVAMACGSFSMVILLYCATRATRTRRVTRWIQVSFGVVAVGLLIWPHLDTLPHEWYSESVPLTWSQYSEYCSPDDSGAVKAKYQEKCASLSGLYIHSEGWVDSTSIAAVHNPLANFVSKFPLKVQQVITCMFGERPEPCDGECEETEFLANKCHLSNWNRYEYTIGVKVPVSSSKGEETIILKGGNGFRNFTTSLAPDDKIWFAGLLEINFGSCGKFSQNRILLHQAGCLACSASPSPSPTVQSLTLMPSLPDIDIAFRNFLNFIFNPAVVFKNINGN